CAANAPLDYGRGGPAALRRDTQPLDHVARPADANESLRLGLASQLRSAIDVPGHFSRTLASNGLAAWVSQFHFSGLWRVDAWLAGAERRHSPARPHPRTAAL